MKVWTISEKFQGKLNKLGQLKMEATKARIDFYKKHIGKKPDFISPSESEVFYRKKINAVEGFKIQETTIDQTFPDSVWKVSPDRRRNPGRRYGKEIDSLPKYTMLTAYDVIMEGGWSNIGIKIEKICGIDYIVYASGVELIKQLKKDGCTQIEI